MRGVDDADVRALSGGEIEPIGEPVTLELAEQRQATRLREHLTAHERRAMTDDENVEVGCEHRQRRLGLGVTGCGSPEPGRDGERLEAEICHRGEPGDVDGIDVGSANVFAAGKTDLSPSRHRIATDPSSRRGVCERSAEVGGCRARPASSSSMPRPGRSGARR